MTEVIRISESIFQRLQVLATPLVDTPASVVEKLLDFYDAHNSSSTAQGINTAISGPPQPGPNGRSDAHRNRLSWENKSDAASLAVVDKIVSFFRMDNMEPRVTYNLSHIALGTRGRNFCWFYPKKSAGLCRLELRVASGTRDSVLLSLQQETIDAAPRWADYVSISITAKGLEDRSTIMRDVLKQAEDSSRV